MFGSIKDVHKTPPRQNNLMFQVFHGALQLIPNRKKIKPNGAVVFEIEDFNDFLWAFSCLIKHRFDTCQNVIVGFVNRYFNNVA